MARRGSRPSLANGPNPIGVDYLTRAGMIWKEGEYYLHDASAQPPLCWVQFPSKTRTLTLTLPGDVPLELVHIPPGRYLMGSPATERGRQDGEAQVEVAIDYDFYLGKYEVTEAQWLAVMRPMNAEGRRDETKAPDRPDRCPEQRFQPVQGMGSR